MTNIQEGKMSSWTSAYSLGWSSVLASPSRLCRSLVAELLGTAFLVIIGCGAALNPEPDMDITQHHVLRI